MTVNSIDQIRVDGITYEVDTFETGELGYSAQGQIDYDKAKITLRNQPPAMWLQVFWHEFMHHVSEYRLHGQPLTESQIDGIATSINAMLLDNPNVITEIYCVATDGKFSEECDDDEQDIEDLNFESD